MNRSIWATLFFLIMLTGCFGNSISPEQSIDIEFRFCAPYLNVTKHALPYINYSILDYDPGESVTLELVLTNPTQFHPRNFVLIFNGRVDEADGMTTRGYGDMHNYIMFNDGEPIESGPYVETCTIHFPIGPVYIWGLFGNDLLDETFVYEYNNDPYSYLDHPLYVGELNGSHEPLGYNGVYPSMSGNGRYVAWIQNAYTANDEICVLDMNTQDIFTIPHQSIGSPENVRMGWMVFDYEGQYLAYMYGETVLPYRSYIKLRNMTTGNEIFVEGNESGTETLASFDVRFSGNGKWLGYCINYNPFMNYPYNIFAYNTSTGEKIQITHHGVKPYDQGPSDESRFCCFDWYGEKVFYRHGQFIEVGSGISYMCVYDLRMYDMITGENTLLWNCEGEEYLIDCVYPYAGDYCYVTYSPTQLQDINPDIYKIDINIGNITLIKQDNKLQYGLQISPNGLYLLWFQSYTSNGIYGYSMADGYLGQIASIGMWPNTGV